MFVTLKLDGLMFENAEIKTNFWLINISIVSFQL